MNLIKLGWSDFFKTDYENRYSNEFAVGRVISQGKNVYKLSTSNGEIFGKSSGKFQYETAHQSDFPVVGDWVVLKYEIGDQFGVIQGVLKRKSAFSRKVNGNNIEEQVIASNIDIIFIVAALNKDFNVRRLERYLTLAWESGAIPIIILTKSDLCENVEEKKRELEDIAVGVPIHITSSVTNKGIDKLKAYFVEGKTIALLGSSGVGKSTITNMLKGTNVQSVNTLRNDDKGKHTTTSRDLIFLDKGMIIDTPGLRELQLWGSENSLSQTFQDIKDLEEDCKFRDCTHETEPGCAVRVALNNQTLTMNRYQSYLKLTKEISFLNNSSEYLRNKEEMMKNFRKEAKRGLKKRK